MDPLDKLLLVDIVVWFAKIVTAGFILWCVLKLL